MQYDSLCNNGFESAHTKIKYTVHLSLQTYERSLPYLCEYGSSGDET
jgi:hypothetical protein